MTSLMTRHARIEYRWPGFALVADPVTGLVLTEYPDGHWSGGPVVPADVEHAERLGLASPWDHRIVHELGHHVVALARGVGDGQTGCRIIHRNAHGEPQREPEAQQDEWVITAVTYLAHGAPMRDAGDYGALIDLQRAGVDVPALAARLRWLLDAPRHGVAAVVVAKALAR